MTTKAAKGPAADRRIDRTRDIPRAQPRLATMLFGVIATDAPTYLVVLIAILPVIALAAVVLAARAARVDPMIALHNE